MLTADALAEDDIVHPGRGEQANKLYREHADMKVRRFEPEHKPKDGPHREVRRAAIGPL